MRRNSSYLIYYIYSYNEIFLSIFPINEESHFDAGAVGAPKKRRMKMITIKEYRYLTDGSAECAARWNIPSAHTKKAGAAFAAACDSVRSSGLRGGVKVFRDGVLDEWPHLDEQGRLC